MRRPRLPCLCDRRGGRYCNEARRRIGQDGPHAALDLGHLGEQHHRIEVALHGPAIDRVTYLHLEYVGPQRLFVVAAVDLTGDDREPDLAVRLRKVETDIEEHELIEDAVLTLSLPQDASLTA